MFPRLFADDMAYINSRQREQNTVKRLHGNNHERLAQTLFKQGASLEFRIIAHVWRYTNELRSVTRFHVGILVRLSERFTKSGVIATLRLLFARTGERKAQTCAK